MPIDYQKFIHPADREALKKLQAIPMLDTITRQFLKYFTEDMLHGFNMASKIRITEEQLPHLHQTLIEVCSRLQIEVPEFYLEMDPNPNAYTCGDTKPFVVINSGLIDLLKPDEIKAVIAHECGHILCHHVLYHSLADFLVSAGSEVGSIFGLGLISDPLKWALMYWVRRSEFSADRVGAYVMNDADVVVRTMMRLSGGSEKITQSVNIEKYLDQATDYDKFIHDSSKSKILQYWLIKDMSHPFPAVRAAEVRKWFKTSGHLIANNSLEDFSQAKLNW